MRRLKFQNKKFDAIFANYSLIHTLEDDIELTLREFARVLKPKGFLYLSLQSPLKQKDKDGYYPVVYKKKTSLFINLVIKAFTHQKIAKLLTC